jgi:signal peptidase I
MSDHARQEREGGAVDPPADSRPARPPLRGLLEQVQTILVAMVLALGIRAFVIEPYRIPSGSMLPTLLIGDHLFVNKFLYGIQIPWTDIRLPAVRGPQRGDVVVFTVARDGRDIVSADRRPELPRDRFVKRIVGLPGDTIEVRNGAVTVNGEPVERWETGEAFADGSGRSLKIFRERLGEREHAGLDDPLRPGEEGRFVVEDERYFMMGDNRDDSNDSRSWGTVRLDEFKGPAFVLYWSWDFNGSWASLANPLTWWELMTQRMRWTRVGDRIE